MPDAGAVARIIERLGLASYADRKAGALSTGNLQRLGLSRALLDEALKARRSRAIWLTAASFMMLPLVGGLMMIILKDPVRAREMGLISAKAQLLAGVADWPTFFGILTQGIAILGA